MGRSRLSSDCSACGKKKACGKHHVYAIELNPEVLNDESFFPDRASLKEDARCFYIGQTTHRPDCRYKQHVRKNRKNKNFNCYCEAGDPVRTAFTAFNRGNKYVRDYHLPGGLKPEIFSELNPIVEGREKALRIEAELAEKLIREGHAVHFN